MSESIEGFLYLTETESQELTKYAAGRPLVIDYGPDFIRLNMVSSPWAVLLITAWRLSPDGMSSRRMIVADDIAFLIHRISQIEEALTADVTSYSEGGKMYMRAQKAQIEAELASLLGRWRAFVPTTLLESNVLRHAVTVP